MRRQSRVLSGAGQSAWGREARRGAGRPVSRQSSVALALLLLIGEFWGGTGAVQAAGPRVSGMLGGHPWSWGWNLGGQLGTGTRTDSTGPGAVRGLGAVTVVAAGTLHSLALTADGRVWAWGGNTDGQLGSGVSRRGSALPLRVSGLTHIAAIATGSLHNLALGADGAVWTWGSNAAEELGAVAVCAAPDKETCRGDTPAPHQPA